MSTGASKLIGQSASILLQKTRATAEAGTKKSHYRPLPKEFRHDGFTFRQIAHEGNVRIYEQTWNGCQSPRLAYEVIRVRRREGFHIGGKFVPAAEVYPKSQAWGTHAFIFTDSDAAFAKLREMEAR
jgi:hypothetical protein